jgi:hypothetical protein
MASGDKADTGRKRRKPDKKTEKSQRERFIETARALDSDETGREFDKALGRIFPRKSSSKPTS